MKVLSKEELRKAEEELRQYFPQSKQVCKQHCLYTINAFRVCFLSWWKSVFLQLFKKVRNEMCMLIIIIFIVVFVVVFIHASVFGYLGKGKLKWKKRMG